ncbi:hypothetical protein C0Q70_07200 [Pomacea canaliculata]|uniref:L-Fucosyltransferase n=2 Tax=Pomacea canaliculata TaxID=400727 RepID=A0A2T7PED7_POMCA|nr:hypothetical protein C0Q70_07200 [Pomacea canaliculata]
MVCLAILMMVMVVWKDSFQISAVYQPAATSNPQIQPELNVSLTMSTPTPTTTMPPPPSSRLLCHSFDGRLGNQMFQVASILGLAWTMNRTPVFVGDFQLERLLEHSLKWSNQAELEKRCSKAQVIHEDNCYRFKYSFAELDPKIDFSLGTYLQSWKYFDKFRAQVKRALVFNQNVVKKAATIVEKIRDRHKKDHTHRRSHQEKRL